MLEEKISLKEAKRAGIIDDDFKPVIEVRAFATRARIADILDTDYEPKKVLVGDARRIVGQELSSKSLSDMDYLKWFGKVLGRSVGLMHKNGWYHQYLTSHNITLDGRIVDLDSLEQLVDHWEGNEDYAEAKGALKQLYRAVRGGLGVPHDYDLAFAYAYNEAFPVEVRKQYYAQHGEMLEEH